MVAHGGTSVAGSFIQTLTMVDVSTGWTERLPLVTRESGLVVQAMERAHSLFSWLKIEAEARSAVDAFIRGGGALNSIRRREGAWGSCLNLEATIASLHHRYLSKRLTRPATRTILSKESRSPQASGNRPGNFLV
jgi:hypothetical protein